MRRFVFVLQCLLLLGLFVRGAAAEPAAVATLTRKEIALGEEVALEVRIQGGSQLRWQGALQVEGLEISGPRMESQIGLGNLFGGSGGGGGITLAFTVLPLRAGDFTIPSISLSVDGRAVRTQPVGLKVRPDGAGTQASRPDQPTLGLVELVMPDGPYYVGQLIPLEIRLAGASNLRWQPEAMPELGGDGFTKLKFPEPKQQQGERNGETLDVYPFRTAITPSKAGKLTLGPVEVAYAAIVPRAKPRRQRSFFDDIFSDPAFGMTQHFKAQAKARELEVKPLPAVGRPESFSGGIGDFVFAAEGSPARVKVGDPVTMKLTVKGSGNFDRISAPTLKTPAGWRTYPPAAEFRASDDLGLAGTKTFSVAVIPEAQQKAMPVFEFSYFDPRKGKYVTLASEPQSLVVEGGAPPAPLAATRQLAEPAAPAPEAAPPGDILGLRYDVGPAHRTFAPLYTNRLFWGAQAVPALALIGWMFSKRRRAGADEKRRRVWRREHSALKGRLRAGGGNDDEFLETAAQVIRLATAIATGREAASIDAAAALAAKPVDAETAHGVERIFSARAELLYAGGNGGSPRLSPEQRREVLETIERFEKGHARA